MIWQSSTIMTIFDVIIVLLALGSAVVVARNWQLLSRLGTLSSTAIVVGAFALLAAMYLYDLATMHIFPALLGAERSMGLMKDLHLNYAWIGIAVVSMLMFIGISLLIGRFTQIHTQLTQHKEHLEELVDERTHHLEHQITEREYAEASLRESEARLLQILDNSPFAITVISRRGEKKRLYVNQSFREMFDFRLDSSYRENQIAKSYVNPADLEEAWATFEREGVIDAIERERKHANGTVWWALSNWRPLTFAGEEAVMIWTFDISERKRTEEALAEKEAQLRLALDNMRGGIFMVDKDLNLKVFSESFGECYKFPKRLLRKGASLIPIIEFRAKRGDYGPGDPAELVRTRIEGYRSFEERRVEDRLPGGRIVELFRTVTEDGGVVAVFNDITDRKQAEEELKAQTELVDMLRTTAADANKATNFDNAMHTCLAAVNDYTGWPVGHVYLLSDEDDDVLVPSGIWHLENPKRFAVFVEATKKTTFERGVGLPGRVLESGEPAWIVDVSKDSNFPRAKLAEDIGVHGAFAFPVLSGDKVVAVLEFFDEKVDEPDETLLAAVVHIGGQLGRVFERKRAETKLRNAMDEIDEANRSLERKVKARTRELHEAKDEAEAARQEAETANLTKSEFLANMSHELRTPLNAIIGFSGMIKGAMFGPLESKYQDHASDINASGEHLLGIIADILDISKVEAGALDIEEEEVDLAETAAACEMMVSGRAEEAGVTLTFDVAAELPSLHADPLRLKQILLNLIANAIKFTPQGGRITVTGETNGNGGVALVVRDTGVGITKEDIPKVLEKFGQIRDGHMHAHEGTGLGLALAKSLMERHGGTLVIESEVGKGTTVTVTFPPERTKKPPGRRTAKGSG